MSPPSARRCLW